MVHPLYIRLGNPECWLPPPHSVNAQLFSHLQLFPTPWPVACQGPLSMGFPRQEYHSGLLFLSPGDLPKPQIEPPAPALADGLFTTKLSGKPFLNGYPGVKLTDGILKRLI